MDRSEVIELKKKLDVTDLSGEKVMIDFESGKYFMIKGAGNDIWDMIQEKITVGEIIDNLMGEYDVPLDTCTQSVESFLTNLKKLEFI